METMNEEAPKKSLNFIETFVEQDLADGKMEAGFRPAFLLNPMVICT